jgi:hypothetical protein
LLSTDNNVDWASIPFNIQAADNPVPVPISKNRPWGLVAAKVLKKLPVKISDPILKSNDRVPFKISWYGGGNEILFASFKAYLRNLNCDYSDGKTKTHGRPVFFNIWRESRNP